MDRIPPPPLSSAHLFRCPSHPGHPHRHTPWPSPADPYNGPSRQRTWTLQGRERPPLQGPQKGILVIRMSSPGKALGLRYVQGQQNEWAKAGRPGCPGRAQSARGVSRVSVPSFGAGFTRLRSFVPFREPVMDKPRACRPKPSCSETELPGSQGIPVCSVNPPKSVVTMGPWASLWFSSENKKGPKHGKDVQYHHKLKPLETAVKSPASLRARAPGGE